MVRCFVRGFVFLYSLLWGGVIVAQEAPDLSLDELPSIARDLIDEAAKKNDPLVVKAVAEATKGVLPAFSDGIDAYSNWTLQRIASGARDGVHIAENIAGEASDTAAEQATETSDAPLTAVAERQVSTGLFAIAPWTGKVGATAISAAGNSQNTALGFFLNAKRETGKFAHDVAGYFDVGRANEVLVQRRWGAAYKLDYAFSNRLSVFGRIAYDEDDFSGFDYRLFANTGLGYFIKKSEKLTWKVDGGPGFRLSPIDDTDETISDFTLYAGSDFDWVIREGLTFTSDAGVTWASTTTTFESTTGINATLWGGLVAGLSYYVRHETNPPDGINPLTGNPFVNTDTTLRATLGYEF